MPPAKVISVPVEVWPSGILWLGKKFRLSRSSARAFVGRAS